MCTYTIQKTQGKPDWQAIPVMQMRALSWANDTDITAQAQLCWDENALYVRLEAVEPHIRKEETGALAKTWEDSCLELFLRPTERPDYFNIEMTPNRAIFLGFGTEKSNIIRLLVRNVEALLDSQVEFTDGGWVLTYQVPFAFIRRFFPEFEAKKGVKMYGNTYKCGDCTVAPHYMAWAPIARPEDSFHCPKQFGTLILG